MRRLIVILIVLITFFVANLILFNFSQDYKFFVKKLKNPNEVVYVKDKELLDEVDNTNKKISINTNT
jgi:hypothetical protein